MTAVRLPVRTRAATAAGRATAALSRRLGRGNGSVIGGRVLMAIDPDALARLATGHRAALISGTNGKTTTTRMLAAALGTAGPVVTNVRGANMPPGLAAALSDGDAHLAALEVDEAWLPAIAEAVRPEVVVLLNLSRDQLDRNNEVRALSATWRKAVAALEPATTVVANADDPLTAWAAMASDNVTWVAAGQPWTADASGCPKCGGRLV